MIAFLFFTLAAAAPFPRPVIRTAATISPGFGWSSTPSIYVHSGLDVHFRPRVSARSDLYLSVGTAEKHLAHNHALLTGAAYHFLNGRLDPWVSFQPGLAVTATRPSGPGAEAGTLMVSPLAAVGSGVNLYVSPLFHFFGEARGLVGQHLADPRASLNELRVSFGLGIQLGRMRLAPRS